MELHSKSKIFVAGHRGLVGSAIVRRLRKEGFENLLLTTKLELDLRDSIKTREFFCREHPEFVLLAAAKVGGIGGNTTYPVEFLLENLQIQNNVISSAAESNVQKLVFLGSSCIYPKEAKYPLTEDQLLTGPLEPTNEPYAIAKIAGIKLCQSYSKQYSKNFISVMPTNLYGPNDFYDLESSHVIPAVMLKILQAKKAGLKSVTLWGSGKPFREFLHSDDLAEAVLICLKKYNDPALINIGSQEEISISELASLARGTCGFEGEILWDDSKPDGTFRKVMDSTKMRNLGWSAKIPLREGLKTIVAEAQRRLDLYATEGRGSYQQIAP